MDFDEPETFLLNLYSYWILFFASQYFHHKLLIYKFNTSSYLPEQS